MPGKDATSRAVAAISDAIQERRGSASRPLLVALDGRSGAGKSTVAALLAAQLAAALIDGDDFYAGGTADEWDARSPAVNADHCIDWRRLRAKALEPLLTGRTASWHPYDWDAGGGLTSVPITCAPADVIVLDGAYSTRPELADLVGLTVLVEAPAHERRARVAARDGPLDEEWFARWDAAEDHYFTHTRPAARFDLVVSTASAAQSSPTADGAQSQQHQHEPGNRKDR